MVARYPKGTTAIDGGFKTASTSAYFNRSSGFGRNWSVEVTSIGSTPQETYDVQAYCVRGKVQRVEASDVLPGSGGPAPGEEGTSAKTPGCAKGRFVRGGGYGASPPAAGLTSGAVVFGDVLARSGWKVSAQTISGSPQSFSLFGYCRPG